MTFNAYPAAADVVSLLAGVGITLPTAMTTVVGESVSELAIFTDEAIGEFERRTGRRPYLNPGGSTVTSRNYDPPGCQAVDYGVQDGGGMRLRLGCDLISLTSIVCEGTSLVPGSDCWLEPENGPAAVLRFRVPVYGSPSSVVVTGAFGTVTSLTTDVWNCVRKLAGLKAINGLLERIRASGVSRMNETDDNIQFEPKFIDGTTSTWKTETDLVIVQNTRMSAYI